MKHSRYLILWALGTGVVLLVAFSQNVPGYMDAEYYFAGGLRLVRGEGFTETFLWNYLNDPIALPAPSHIYWMPLPSILAALGMWLTHSEGYFSARLPFLFLAGLIPPFTAWVSYRIARSERGALFGGVLAVFSGFYLVYTGLVETFTLYMLLGGGFLTIAYEQEISWLKFRSSLLRYFILGLIAGLMHMTRADGLLWLAIALILAMFDARHDSGLLIRKKSLRLICLGLVCCAGYAVITFAWYGRNQDNFGGLLPPGNSRALWITDYDQTFNYPADQLTMENWFKADFGIHLQSWAGALASNIGTALGVQGGIFLFPLILLGYWRLRQDKRIRLTGYLWIMTLIIMTFIFPFAGARGGFLHSGAALQIYFWAMIPEGLSGFVEWGARIRGWKKKSSYKVFSFMLASVAIILTVLIFFVRVINPEGGAWDASHQSYLRVNQVLDSFAPEQERVVLVNNPPGYYLASGDHALVIPNGDVTTLMAVADRFSADYIVLERSIVKGLQDLYLNPRDIGRLLYIGDIGEARLFEVEK